MIEITKEMRQQSKKEKDELVKRIDENIIKARDKGYTRAHFAIRTTNKYYDEIRNEYERHGYKIKPTGYIQGVWQITEDICW